MRRDRRCVIDSALTTIQRKLDNRQAMREQAFIADDRIVRVALVSDAGIFTWGTEELTIVSSFRHSIGVEEERVPRRQPKIDRRVARIRGEAQDRPRLTDLPDLAGSRDQQQAGA